MLHLIALFIGYAALFAAAALGITVLMLSLYSGRFANYLLHGSKRKQGIIYVNREFR